MWVIGKNIYYIARVLFIGRHNIFFSLLLLSLSFYFVIEVRYRLLAYSLARLPFLFSTVTHLYQVPYQQLIIFRKTLVFFYFYVLVRIRPQLVIFRVCVSHTRPACVCGCVWFFFFLFLLFFFFSIFYHFLHFYVVNAKNARERISRIREITKSFRSLLTFLFEKKYNDRTWRSIAFKIRVFTHSRICALVGSCES